MDCTTLKLLTRDGALAVTFTPGLTPDQYSELYELVIDAETADEMTAVVKRAGLRWGADVVVDPPGTSRSRRPAGRATRGH